jgi:hypothetical protein
MAAAPKVTQLKAEDLQIADGPIAGTGLRDALRRLFSTLNPFFDGLNKVFSKGITLSENVRCEIVAGQFSHGVTQYVTLRTLTRAAGAIALGADMLTASTGARTGQLVKAVAVQPSDLNNGKNQVRVTVWFYNAGAVNVDTTLILLPEGQLCSSTPAAP